MAFPTLRKRKTPLKNRKKNDGDGDDEMHLPHHTKQKNTNSTGTSTNKMNEGFMKKCCRILYKILYRFGCITFTLLVLAVVFCFVFVQGMTRYNARKATNPCTVAETSLETINLLKKTSRSIQPLDLIIRDKTDKEIVRLEMEGNEFQSEIPKIIHQQWKDDDVPKKFWKYREQWFKYFPKGEYEYKLWTDTSARELIVEHYPWFLPTFDGYNHNINRVDATRYFILYHYGGIYADLDYEPLMNFYDYFPHNMVSVIGSPYVWNEKTQNALMSSPQYDPFWVDTFNQLIKNAEKKGANILEVSGPILIDQSMDRSRQPVYVLPCENFQRVPIGEYDQTLRSTVVEREITFRLKPFNGKHCGLYSDDRCHFGKHHNTCSYVRKNGSIL